MLSATGCGFICWSSFSYLFMNLNITVFFSAILFILNAHMFGSSYSLHHSISRDINYIHFQLTLNFCCSYETLYFFLTQNLYLDVIVIKMPFKESEDCAACNKLIMQNPVWLTSNNNKKRNGMKKNTFYQISDFLATTGSKRCAFESVLVTRCFLVCRISLSGSTAVAKYTFSTLSFINVSYIKRLQNNSILMRMSLPVSLLCFSPFIFHNSDTFSVSKKQQYSADASIFFFFEVCNILSSSWSVEWRRIRKEN